MLSKLVSPVWNNSSALLTKPLNSVAILPSSPLRVFLVAASNKLNEA
jgi:hypothetical protein